MMWTCEVDITESWRATLITCLIGQDYAYQRALQRIGNRYFFATAIRTMPPRLQLKIDLPHLYTIPKPWARQKQPLTVQSRRRLETLTQDFNSDPHVEVLSQQAKAPSRPRTRIESVQSAQYNLDRAPRPPSATRKPLVLTPSVHEQFPFLTSQPPFYARIHIHAKPYMITEGDSIRLPFLMHGVKPGDVLRLNCATSIGSRDFTIIGGAPIKSFKERIDDITSPSLSSSFSNSTVAEPIVGKTEDLGLDRTQESQAQGKLINKKGPPAYLDDRLFVCRAVVMGTESEPMRVKEKTKRRQRHVKHVRSKHRYTILKIRELSLKSLEELKNEVAAMAT